MQYNEWCETVYQWFTPWVSLDVFHWQKQYEWMRHLYSTYICTTVHPKCFTVISGNLSSLPPVYSIHLDYVMAAIVPVRSPHTSIYTKYTVVNIRIGSKPFIEVIHEFWTTPVPVLEQLNIWSVPVLNGVIVVWKIHSWQFIFYSTTLCKLF